MDYAIALNLASADKNEADQMMARLELSREQKLVDWDATFARRDNERADDGWEGIILADGTELIWDGWRWR
jgi:hypothetical protein